MPIVTITVNQWAIKRNAGKSEEDKEPVLCVNEYAGRDGKEWGEQTAEPQHFFAYPIPEGDAVHATRVVYDSGFKTPCGASCWMEYRY